MSQYCWDNTAQAKTLCNVAQETPDNSAQEKTQCNVVRMLEMPHQHCTNFPDIAPEKSRVNIEQKDKIVRNIRIKSTEYSHNKTNMDAFIFAAIVASRSYHVYKKKSWINAEVGDKVTVGLETTASSLETDPYACAIRIKHKYFSNLITVGYIPHKISRHVHFFIKTEGGKVNGHVKFLTYRPSPLSPGSLEIPLQLTFSRGQGKTLDKMNAFVNSLYDWNYTGTVNPEENEENDEENTDDEDFVRTSCTSAMM